jgi:spermidine/putrescine transport system permease protein
MRKLFSGGENRQFLLALPAIFWLVFFFLLPLLFILGTSFMSRGLGGIPELPLTLTHYDRTFGVFSSILWRSLWISGITMLACLLIGYPLAFFISTRHSKRFQQFCLFLVILPFWTNFLIRTYAWRILLGEEGTINSLLQSIGLIEESLRLLNTPLAVVIGLVYGFLPFMVLPIYASVERFDFRFVDAAHDLGANDWRVFWRVVFPLTLPGVYAGCALVFIPSVGAFITPDLLGGTRGLMIGNLIEGQFTGSGNMPLGSALSIVMMGAVMLALMVYVIFGTRNRGEN